jgi:hypothetical protein
MCAALVKAAEQINCCPAPSKAHVLACMHNTHMHLNIDSKTGNSTA